MCFTMNCSSLLYRSTILFEIILSYSFRSVSISIASWLNRVGFKLHSYVAFINARKLYSNYNKLVYSKIKVSFCCCIDVFVCVYILFLCVMHVCVVCFCLLCEGVCAFAICSCFFSFHLSHSYQLALFVLYMYVFSIHTQIQQITIYIDL